MCQGYPVPFCGRVGVPNSIFRVSPIKGKMKAFLKFQSPPLPQTPIRFLERKKPLGLVAGEASLQNIYHLWGQLGKSCAGFNQNVFKSKDPLPNSRKVPKQCES